MSINQWKSKDCHASSKVLSSNFSSKFCSSSVSFTRQFCCLLPRPWFLLFISTMARLVLIEWQTCLPLQGTALSVHCSACQEYQCCSLQIHWWANIALTWEPLGQLHSWCQSVLGRDTDLQQRRGGHGSSQNNSSWPMIPASLSKCIFPHRIEVCCLVIWAYNGLLNVPIPGVFCLCVQNKQPDSHIKIRSSDSFLNIEALC